jgi:hypothetical protein
MNTMTQYDVEHFERARQKARLDPDALTEADVAQLEIVDPTIIVKARAERAAALAPTPVEQQHRTDTAGMREDEDFDAYIERAHDQPAKMWHLGAITDAIKTLVPRASSGNSRLEDQVKALSASLAASNARIKALESRPPGLTYRGVFETGTLYQKHEGVTSSGSLWVCLEGTSERPPSPKWQLAAKRGADGKDAR